MRRLATLLLCSAALVGGCSSDDEPATGAESTPTPAQEQQQDRGGYSY